MQVLSIEKLSKFFGDVHAFSKNALADMPKIRDRIDEPGMPDAAKMARIVTKAGNKMERAGDYLFPPVIGLKTIE